MIIWCEAGYWLVVIADRMHAWYCNVVCLVNSPRVQPGFLFSSQTSLGHVLCTSAGWWSLNIYARLTPILNKEQKHNWYIATCFPLYASQCWGKKLIIQEADQRRGRQSQLAGRLLGQLSLSSTGGVGMSPGSDKTVSHGWSFIIKVRSITIHSNLSGP